MFYPKNEVMAFPNIGMRSMQELFFQLGGLRWDTLCTERFHFCNRKRAQLSNGEKYRITTP